MKLSRDPAQGRNSAPPPVSRRTTSNAKKWYLVANGQNALIFHEKNGVLVQIADITPTEEFTHTRAQKTNGHQPGGEGSVYYTSDPMDRKDDHDERMFLSNVADWLKKALDQDKFNKLVIAASPNALGLLRDCLDHRVEDIVVREINKDYTNMPLAELEKALL